MKNDSIQRFRNQPLFVPYVTYAICVLSAALSIGFWMTGMRDNTWGLVSAPRIWSGDWGGLLTSTFLHASPQQNPTHLLFNLLVLFSFGPIIERAIGRLEFIIFCAAAACVATAAELSVTGVNSIGLSGMIYGLVGLAWGAKKTIPAFQLIANTKNMQMFIGWLILCFILTESHFMNVANYAHVGGLLFGVAIAWLFVERTQPVRFRIAGAALLAALTAVTVLSVSYLPWTPTWQYWHEERQLGIPDTIDNDIR